MNPINQLTAHLIGDYLIQSDWMATEKLNNSAVAAAHAATYTLPFAALTRDPRRLAFIAGTHFVIDRWRLARYVVWAKNQLAPRSARYPWSHGRGTGYHGPIEYDWNRAAAIGRMRAINEPESVEKGPDYVYAQRSPELMPSAAEIHSHDTRCQVTERPPWMAVWLMIVADNTMHGLCNAVALGWRNE